MIQRDDATQRQVDAADPRASTWLSANAGSGKTRVLTDRVARLLLEGTEPQNILCLTYTTAAAGEMQNRLFSRLGKWAMMEDGALRADLEKMGAGPAPDGDTLREARRLFARAIETPGGLKIQTIHSFCAMILRRFPLEAGISPQFREMDEISAQHALMDTLDAMASGKGAAEIDAVVRYLHDKNLISFAKQVAKERDFFFSPCSTDDLRTALGLTPQDSHETAFAHALDGGKAVVDQLKDVRSALSPKYREDLAVLEQIDFSAPSREGYEAACRMFIDSKNEPKIGRYPQTNHKQVRAVCDHFLDEIDAWIAQVAEARDTVLSLDALPKSVALHGFGQKFVSLYEERKLRAGLVDFDDLIRKARLLLTDAAVAQWVLFKLDGGIDHILVDEAQDTSPAQWDVVRALASEFASGEGAQPERERTIFVVGDKKQSIYSFQGADPAGFDRMRAHFDGQLSAIEKRLASLTLQHSFRSSHAILSLVDRCFESDRGAGLDDDMNHIAFKEALPGRVDLWPALEVSQKAEDETAWYDPVDLPSEEHHDIRLAEMIADEIGRMIREETIPDEDENHQIIRRPVRAGDFLILVRKRAGLGEQIIRACKAKELNVAGADRLIVSDSLAVRDVLALLNFLALPEDSLSLATSLKSPLFGWSEQELFTLAHHRRQEYLWPALREAKDQHEDTFAILTDLRDQADFLRPYELIQRILIQHGGRLRLLARLGEEAEDSLDALLSQALDYERSATPSLTGFLCWITGGETQLKRELDSAGDRIRVMTVHGSKGLESPIVILPDTVADSSRQTEQFFQSASTLLWAPNKNERPRAIHGLADEAEQRQNEEKRRLLYVAMTRAEKWLIVAGAGKQGTSPFNWYQTVSDGMQAAGALPCVMPSGEGLRLAHLDWEAPPLKEHAPLRPTRPQRPVFGKTPTPPKTQRTLAPSDLGGAKVVAEATADGASEEVALATGRLMHRLLEYLPAMPPEERGAVARMICDNDPDAALVPNAKQIAIDAVSLVGEPSLGFLFNSDGLSEVPVTAALPELDGRRMHGTIDRLIVNERTVLSVDFKTNRIVPERPEDTPEAILRQLGAYASALKQFYPDHAIHSAVLWTAEAKLMPVPEELILEALRRSAVP